MNYWEMLKADRLMRITQLAFWPAYLLISYWGNGIIPAEDNKFTFGEVAVISAIQASLFYVLVFFIWRVAYAKRIGKWLGVMVFMLVLLMPAFAFLFHHVLPTWFDLWVYTPGSVSAQERILFKIVQQYIHLGSLAGLFVYRYYSVSQEVLKREAIKQKHRFERRFLTAAVDPHLLNSMLTNVKLELNGMKTEAAEKLAAVVQSFADMIAYGLSYAKDAVLNVPLKQELAQAKRYIEVQSFRLNQALPVYVLPTGCIDVWTIPPVVLNTILGDVFRYGVTTNHKHPVTLHIHADTHKLYIRCRNRIGNPQGRKTGIGLGNRLIKRLMELAHPGKSTYKAHILPDGVYETSITLNKPDDAKI